MESLGSNGIENVVSTPQQERRHRRPVAYLVLAKAHEPVLLARLRWPDVFQAISPVRPQWEDDPALFDLPYATGSTAVAPEAAADLAAQWGSRLPSEEADHGSGLSLIRRMPSDWSNLSMAEKRAWSIVVGKSRKARRWGRRRTEMPAADEWQVNDDLAPAGSVLSVEDEPDGAMPAVGRTATPW